MWYAVFSYSMISMVFASLTMLGYLSIQLNEPLYAGPFYFVFPLPLALVYFWYYCEHKFKNVSMVRPPLRHDDANDDVDVHDDVDTLSDHEAVDEDDDTHNGDDCECIQNLSFDFAKELDVRNRERESAGRLVPQNSFTQDLYRQPSLAAGVMMML